MTRRMSCSMTVLPVIRREKFVTRRHEDTWKTLKPGDRLVLIEKGMGLAKGARQRVLAEVKVTAVDLVRLYEIDDAEVVLEGFPEMETTDFIEMWLASHPHPPFHTQDEAMRYKVRRIEWRYLPVSEWHVRQAAAEVFTPEGVDLWYDAPNRALDGWSPRELVAQGDGLRVLRLIDRLDSGAFA